MSHALPGKHTGVLVNKLDILTPGSRCDRDGPWQEDQGDWRIDQLRGESVWGDGGRDDRGKLEKTGAPGAIGDLLPGFKGSRNDGKGAIWKWGGPLPNKN